MNFIEKIILETKLTREEYKVKLVALLAFKVLGHYIFFFMMASRLKIWEVGLGFLSLYQDVTHGFDVLVSIIWPELCLISTRVGIIRSTSCAKTNSGVTGTTVILLVSRDADSCFGIKRVVSHRIESFHIAVELQGSP